MLTVTFPRLLAGLRRRPDLAQVRDLLERATYDLEHGWPDAAYDCIRRAQRLLAISQGDP